MEPHHSSHPARPRKSRPQSNGSKGGGARKIGVHKGPEILRKGVSRVFAQLGFDPDDIVIFLWPQQNGKMNLAYVPSEYRTGAGQFVHWVSVFGPFSITTLAASPFEQVCYQSVPSPTGYRVEAKVEDVPTGTYRYAVALTAGDGNVYVDPSCPPIIVE